MTGSQLFIGKVSHVRLTPIKHGFGYPLYLYAFELDQLTDLDKRHWWFGYNRWAPVSIWDHDYLASRSNGCGAQLPDDKASIRERLEFFLAQNDFIGKPSRIVLITGARFFNYVFNPVSFFYCYDASKILSCVVVEINNTFDERHLYILKVHDALSKAVESDGVRRFRFQQAKAFHVSPFNDMEGLYNFSLTDIETKLEIGIDISKGGDNAFCSKLSGEMIPLSTVNLVRSLARFPLSAVLAMPRILWQAALLYYRHKLPVFTKPKPTSVLTIKPADPTWSERTAMRAVVRVLSQANVGMLTITLPRGKQLLFGNPRSGKAVSLNVNRFQFFKRVAFAGAVGLGESYQDGEWESDDLVGVLRFLIDNLKQVNQDKFPLSRYRRFIDWVQHKLRPNSSIGSRKNIKAHYDFGNEFFQRILDPGMTYSSAVFESQDETLEIAQARKISLLLEKARVGSTDTVLEIGSGWGSLAIQAARENGCKITSITLSDEQYRFANEKIKQLDLSDKATVEKIDYRQVNGTYDRIISVEMLEAVGHENLDTFFSTCERLLKPEGLLVLQVITIPEERHKRYLRSCDWIQKHIFPGASIPSLLSIVESVARSSGFVIEHVENFPGSYARTLHLWRSRLLSAAKAGELRDLSGYALRTWDYYFAYCQAAFECRALGLHQIVLSRAGNVFLRDQDPALKGKEPSSFQARA